MPKEIFDRDFAFLPRAELLTFEEITWLATLFASEGVSKIRLIGGEPLLRRDLEQLVAMLADVEGIADIPLTTNGSALEAKAKVLKDAGLTRVTVSLDALDDTTFAAINDVHFGGAGARWNRCRGVCCAGARQGQHGRQARRVGSRLLYPEIASRS